jgi:hypothetical protein
MHECQFCGMSCDCDGEDHGGLQPRDCDHFFVPGVCSADEEYNEDDNVED